MSKSTNDLLLRVQNFSVAYQPTIYKSRSIRDLFVGALTKPTSLLPGAKDRLVIMDNISLDIYRGDVVGLLGANGAGKTTLCRYFSGIIQSKHVDILGEVRAIFDTNISFYPNLTGRENTIMLTEVMYAQCSKEEKKRMIEEAIEFSDLAEFIDIPINNYSRGMRAKLYLSLVTAKETDLLILDEVFGGTDHFFAEKLEKRMKNLIQKSGAVLMVSHDTGDIEKYCNRAVVLTQKKISFDGDPALALEKYSKG